MLSKAAKNRFEKRMENNKKLRDRLDKEYREKINVFTIIITFCIIIMFTFMVLYTGEVEKRKNYASLSVYAVGELQKSRLDLQTCQKDLRNDFFNNLNIEVGVYKILNETIYEEKIYWIEFNNTETGGN